MKKTLNIIPIFLLYLFFFSMNNCAKNKTVNSINQSEIIHPKISVKIKDIKNGDLIFVGAQTEELSGAISRVTQLSETKNYDHVGLIELTNDSIFVLHAAPFGGSQREEINHFYHSQTEKNNKIVVYRLKKKFQNSIPNAIITAKSMLGKDYNWEYILNDETLYCSDYIEKAFRKDSIFELIPMNFKNPKTGIIDKFWIDFYAKKNLAVPQDAPGTNPNQLAESNKLIEIGPLYIMKK